MQAPKSRTACTVPGRITTSITHRAHVRTSCPSFLCGRETGPAQREWVFLSNWSASSHGPPCEASESGEVGPVMCIGGDGLELDWSHAACLPSKTHEGGYVCLTVKKREKGRWQLSRGWLAVKRSLFLALSLRSYLKTRYWGLVWGGEGAAIAKKSFEPSEFQCVTCTRGTSLCLVSVISVPFSVITWGLIPPEADCGF